MNWHLSLRLAFLSLLLIHLSGKFQSRRTCVSLCGKSRRFFALLHPEHAFHLYLHGSFYSEFAPIEYYTFFHRLFSDFQHNIRSFHGCSYIIFFFQTMLFLCSQLLFSFVCM